MIEEPNTEEMLRELSDIGSRLEKLANLPPAQSGLPVTYHRPLDLEIYKDLEQAQDCVRSAQRRLRGTGPQSEKDG